MAEVMLDEVAEGERMTTVTLSIDVPRHRHLKRTAALTRISMSEVTRIALDRLWADLSEIDPDERKAMAAIIWAGEGTPITQNRGVPAKNGSGSSRSKKARKTPTK